MKSHWMTCLLLMMLSAAPVFAQVRLAEVSGTVTDESGGVLPGVTVTATHTATAQARSTTTESRGTYVLTALPVGVYEIRGELPGFRPVIITEVRLGIGESARLDIRLKVATITETVTVKGEAPLVDPTKSDLTGRIDQTQIEQLPLSGRNWMNLAALAPGVKSEARGEQPTAGVGDFRMSKAFLDGASVLNRASVGLDLDVSKEVIAEFEVITNRFDAVMGHAGTAITNAVTKSGTDQVHGSTFFYWRDDSLNARDFFTGRVEPFQNRQYGGTLGGPVIKGKTHFFFSYERQVEPKTLSANTGFPLLDAPVESTDTRNLYFGRLDHSVTPNHRLNLRANRFDRDQPNSNVGGPRPLSNGRNISREVHRLAAGLNSVFGGKFVNQLSVTFMDTLGHTNLVTTGHSHVFPALTLGASGTGSGREHSFYYFVRSDASYSFQRVGQHNVKFGGEYEHSNLRGANEGAANGSFFYNQNPLNLATCCASADQSAWDKSRFPIPVRYTQRIGDLSLDNPNDVYSAYLQDDWTLTPRLTLNLGVRYDLEVGSLGHDATGLAVEPHKNDVNNVQPRLGFAWDTLGHAKTIVRGGVGLYYDQVFLNAVAQQRRTNDGKQLVVVTFNPANDPGFAQDPLGGRPFEDFTRGAGALNVTRLAADIRQPHVWTWSVGIAHQVTQALALSADFVMQRSDSMLRGVDANLFCCTPDGNAWPIISGVYPELGGFVAGRGRPDRRFNSISDIRTVGRSRYRGLQVTGTKRMAQGYQFAVAYLLSWTKDDQNGPTSSPNNMFNLADEFARSLQDQRHHLVANWVSRLPYGVNLSGIVSIGSGRTATSAAGGGATVSVTGGVDINGDGTSSGDRPTCGRDPRFTPGCAALGLSDGQRVPRNPFQADALYKLDLRLSRKIRLARFDIDPSLEVFNVFNRRNYDASSYNTNLTTSQFGQPGRSDALPFLPRQVQLGMRMTF